MRGNEILICGAGPVGLTVANCLARHGVPIRLIDAGDGPTTLSKALVVWRRTLQVLDNQIPAEAFIERGNRLGQVAIWGNGKCIAEMTMEDEPLDFPTGLLIPQSETERVLIEQATQRDVTVDWKTNLVDFSAEENEVICRLKTPKGEETQRFSRLIGCDGAHSVVRHTLNLPFPGETVDRRWLLADIEIDQEIDPAMMRAEASPAGMLAIFPIGKERLRIIADGGPMGEHPQRIDPSDEEIQALLDDRTVTGWTIRTIHWKSEFGINERQVENYVHGRVTLAGDAAHVHSPAGGQGMNTGMQDATNMAWKVALVERGGASENLVTTYQEERHRVGEAVLKMTGRGIRAAMVSNPLVRHLRDMVIHIGFSIPAIRRQLTEFLSEENITTRGSRLCGPSVRGAAIQPGDAFPHVAIEQQGKPMRATDLLRGNEATVIVWGKAADATLPAYFGVGDRGFPLTRKILETTGDVAPLLKQFKLEKDGCILVRPDAVVAAFGADTSIIEETFDRWKNL